MRRRRARVAALALAAATVGPACRQVIAPPDLGELYDRVAQVHPPTRNPVVVIPGILGSALEQEGTGRVVWGAFSGDYAHPGRAEGARSIALPMRVGAPLEELRDDVVQAGALESLELRLFGLPVGISAYVNILLALGVGGYRDRDLALGGGVDYGDQHFTCFQFAYDWRRCVSESAAELGRFLEEQAEYVSAEVRRRDGIVLDDVRFDVVAHSMGGLVLRYYLRYGTQPLPADGSLPELTWAGARRVDRAVLIGTPNAGAAGAYLELLEGSKLGPFVPRYSPAILGTFPAVYGLLPRARHGFWTTDDEDASWLADPFDPELWESQGWGLADPSQARVLRWLLPDAASDEDRRRIALDHQAKCLRRARQLHAALDRPAAPPAGCELMLVVGDAIDTPAQVQVRRGEDHCRVVAHAGGDEVVLRSSVLADQRLGSDWGPTVESPIRWARALFLFEDHLGLTKSPVFLDNLLFYLLEEPRGDEFAAASPDD